MRVVAIILAVVAAVLSLSSAALGQVRSGLGGDRPGPPPSGIWEGLNNPAPLPIAQTWLLTDGTVLCQGCLSHEFWKFTPDVNGSYVNGTWSQVSSPLTTSVTVSANSVFQTVGTTAYMRVGQYIYFEFSNSYRRVVGISSSTVVHLDASVNTLAGELVACWGPLYYGSAVLADGRVVAMGGEYNFVPGSANVIWTNLGAIYDPVADSWTPITAPSGWGNIGDAESCILPDGRWALGDPFNTNMVLLDPTTLSWTPTGSGKVDGFDEEGWTLLPEGTMLTIDSGSGGTHGEKYLPSSGSWISAGNTPQGMFASNQETGPQVLRPNGTVFAAGGLSHTAIYTPGAVQTDPGSWVAGPEFPTMVINGTTYQLTMADAPGCLLTTGNVLLCTGPNFNTGRTGVAFFEFDGTNLTPEPATPDAATIYSYSGLMLMLPNGQVMFTDQTGDVELYTLTGGSFQTAWQPTITACPTGVSPGTTITIQGKQFNGLSQCSAYGDDMQNATNYPIVRIRNNATGHIRYARTHDHSTMAVATGSAIVSTQVDLPADLEIGPSKVTVVANGIPSSPLPITVGRPVAGTVNLQNYTASPAGVQVTIEIRSVGSTTPLESDVVTLDAGGNFTYFETVPTGTYDITAKSSHWLRQKLGSQTITAIGVHGLAYSLINGDVNGDNVVSLADFGQLRAAFGSSPGGNNWNPNADLNGDGVVSLADFGILRSNFGKQGDP